jgi:DNA-binding transcriptional ArsR family regulator
MPKQSVYKALAHPVRREILRVLRAGSRPAGDIATEFDLALSTLSGHFNVLKEAGLIQGERTGTTIIYHLNLSVLEEALMGLVSMFDLEGDDHD